MNYSFKTESVVASLIAMLAVVGIWLALMYGVSWLISLMIGFVVANMYPGATEAWLHPNPWVVFVVILLINYVGRLLFKHNSVEKE